MQTEEQIGSKAVWAVLLIVLMAWVEFSGVAQAVERACVVQDGVLDYRHCRYDEVNDLSGSWHFYRSRFFKDIGTEAPEIVQVPDSWENNEIMGYSPFGFGTYRLSVEHLQAGTSYGLKMLDQVSSFRLSVNGKVIGENGQVGRDGSNYRPDWRPLATTFTADKNGRAEFLVEVANFDYYRGGFWNSIRIGPVDKIFHLRQRQLVAEMFLISALLVIGVLFLGMFVISPRERSALYFAVFCLAVSGRVLLTGERQITDLLPVIPWDMRVRLEYLLGYLLLPLMGLFLFSLFPAEFTRKAKKVFQAFLIPAITLPLFLPHAGYSGFLQGYKWLALCCSGWFLMVLFQAIRRRRQGGLLVLLAMLALLAALVKETFWADEMNVVPLATFVLLVCFSLATMQRLMLVLRRNRTLEGKVGRDPLTGLFNRGYFLDYLEHWGEDGEKRSSASLLFLDLDGFKEVNDSFGHDAGDAILVEVSRRLTRLCRSGDILCRYGGDEFLVLIDEDEDNNAEKIAMRIIGKVNEPVPFGDRLLQVGVSVGICRLSGDRPVREVIELSDKAMYRAKAGGGNLFSSYPGRVERAG